MTPPSALSTLCPYTPPTLPPPTTRHHHTNTQFNDLFVEAAGDAKKFIGDRALYLEEAKAALAQAAGNGNGGNGNGNGSKGAVDVGKQVEGLRAVKVSRIWGVGFG
jgi:hypothetical protein